MVEAEANLLQTAAELVRRLRVLEHQYRTTAIPEPEKSACVYLAERNTECAQEVLDELIARYLKSIH